MKCPALKVAMRARCHHAHNCDAVRDDRHQGCDRHQHLTQNGNGAKLFGLDEVVDQHVSPQCDW